MKTKIKDQCEMCGKWKYDCKGFDSKILCPECIKILLTKKR